MKQIVALLVGLGIGLGLALLIGWVALPVGPYDTTPDVLRDDYKEEYVRLVSLTYQVETDREAARTRLAALDALSPTRPLVEQAERWIAQGKVEWMVVPLIRLARDLDAETPVMSRYLQGVIP
ncbi:MAG TPA: hypothetical protein PKH77_03245 [Anaerolineae bacterium]|nr:hypothetical protein [Anaerolineae bacterium]